MSSNVNKFINYCKQNKSIADLRHEFYNSLSPNSKDMKKFGINTNEWFFCVRKAFEQKQRGK